MDRLRAALGKFNPALPPEAINTAIDELTRDRSAMSLEAANREIYRLLKDGIPVSVPDREHGGQKTERLRVVDWEQPGAERLPAGQPVQRRRQPLHLPARSRRLRQRPAVGGGGAEEARRAGARGLRREPHPLQARDPAALLVQRAAHRQQRHGQPRRLAHRRLGALLRVEAHRARGRAAPRVAGGDAARHLRPHPPARPGRELHALLRAQGRAGQDPRPEPPGARRQQRHRLDARSAQAGARARRRLLADPGQRQELLDGLLRPEGAAQAGRQLDLRGGHRPRRAGRPDRQDLQGRGRRVRDRGRPVPRRKRRAPARAAARQPSLRLHADPQVPDAGGC